MEKTIKEIFKDYNSDSVWLNNANIKMINLFKKKKKLEVEIESNNLIKTSSLYEFERYLENRFEIKEVALKVQYKNEIEVDLSEEWNDIINYMTYKYPLTKALLRNSSIQIDNNNLIVSLALKGKEVLYARGFDNVLENILQNLFGKRLKVKYIENITEETLKQREY